MGRADWPTNSSQSCEFTTEASRNSRTFVEDFLLYAGGASSLGPAACTPQTCRQIAPLIGELIHKTPVFCAKRGVGRLIARERNVRDGLLELSRLACLGATLTLAVLI